MDTKGGRLAAPSSFRVRRVRTPLGNAFRPSPLPVPTAACLGGRASPVIHGKARPPRHGTVNRPQTSVRPAAIRIRQQLAPQCLTRRSAPRDNAFSLAGVARTDPPGTESGPDHV